MRFESKRDSPGLGHGVSLWLIPGGEAHDSLAELIRRYSRRFSTPFFEPHLTLVGGIPSSAEERLLRRCADLARDTPAVEIRMSDAGFGESYFRCLYLKVERTPALDQLHERAQALILGREAKPFTPHVSLLYGRLSREQKRDLVDELASLPPASFRAMHLDVLSTEGPATAWRRAARFELERDGGSVGG